MQYVYDFWQGITENTVPLAAVFTCVSFILAFCVAMYFVHAMVALQKRKRREKLRCSEVERRLQYTLPQRENMYVRERLDTALQVQSGEENEKKMKVRLGYARALLYKVQAAPLSTAERLQVEEMAKAFPLYREKETWTAEEVRGVNEWCAALLKLSAKYTV